MSNLTFRLLLPALVLGLAASLSGCGKPNEPELEGKTTAGENAPDSMEEYYEQQQKKQSP